GRFDWRFQKGYHKIMARINFPKDDYFSQNNIYYKSVKSLPRPKLLYVTEKSGPFQTAIEKVYEVDIKGSIPSELSGYDAIIINDIPAVRISNEQVDMIGNYVSDKGKGLIVVGGENSFDQGGYKDSYFESLLPVQVGSGERKRDKKYSVVFVIDLSGTTTLPFKPGAQQSILDFEKAFLFSMVNNLDMEDKISLIGFVSRPYCAPTALHCILTPISLIPDVGGVIQSISSPSGPDADRGTNIALALSRARQSLEKAEGSKNVVLISDGIDTNEYGIMHEIQVMNSFGIRLYNVGVGQFVNRGLLKKMAEQGNGLYFEPDESEKLKIMFMGDESEQKCLKATSGKILLMDNGHWITKGDMALTATAGGYNLVVPKTWGRKLVATDCDRTILTAGKYGLGSIAILSTDDGSKWSGQLFSGDNSKLITRMINWAIGDFTKDSEFDVRMNDVSLGKSTEVNVITNEKPEQKGFEFVKVDTGLYSAVFRPEKEGFEQILGATVAVSYNDEYERIGRNPQLDSMVALSGGKAFDVNDIEGIKDTVISMSRRVKIETINYRWPFVILALIIFLIDVLIRRIRENMGIANF
ncbi:MAG: VWA domain-containing protein, partial [Nanoarchaeota archaeon]|nr:VWA domain-containing protein [Nanoarchaeota archaeon]